MYFFQGACRKAKTSETIRGEDPSRSGRQTTLLLMPWLVGVLPFPVLRSGQGGPDVEGPPGVAPGGRERTHGDRKDAAQQRRRPQREGRGVCGAT